MWWIGDRGEGRAGVENVGVFEDDGTPRKKHPLLLDPSPKAYPLHIARGFALVGDDLYIANAWRSVLSNAIISAFVMSSPSGCSTHRLPALPGPGVERTIVSRLGRMVLSLAPRRRRPTPTSA